MSDSDKTCVILFLRAPEKGKVKTRLGAELDEEIVLALYKHFVADVIGKVQNCGHHYIIGYYPPESEKMVTGWLGKKKNYLRQTGNSIGEKMANAFAHVFSKGYHRSLIVGTDIPGLQESIIQTGIKKLEHHDAVIGPSADGGYYLIGFNADTFHPDYFEHIRWGTKTVFDQTLAAFKQRNSTVYILQKLRDIDTYEDLKYLAQNKKTYYQWAPNTLAYLSKIGFIKKYQQS